MHRPIHGRHQAARSGRGRHAHTSRGRKPVLCYSISLYLKSQPPWLESQKKIPRGLWVRISLSTGQPRGAPTGILQLTGGQGLYFNGKGSHRKNGPTDLRMFPSYTFCSHAGGNSPCKSLARNASLQVLMPLCKKKKASKRPLANLRQGNISMRRVTNQVTIYSCISMSERDSENPCTAGPRKSKPKRGDGNAAQGPCGLLLIPISGRSQESQIGGRSGP